MKMLVLCYISLDFYLLLGGVQPHRHSKIGLWGWGKMGINGEKWGNLETCKIVFRRNNKSIY